jgi:hypothetical protein
MKAGGFWDEWTVSFKAFSGYFALCRNGLAAVPLFMSGSAPVVQIATRIAAGPR